MSIVRRSGEEEVLRKKMFGGEGEAEMHVILKAPEEMFGNSIVAYDLGFCTILCDS